MTNLGFDVSESETDIGASTTADTTSEAWNPRPVSIFVGIFAVTRRWLMKRFDIGGGRSGGAKVTAWVDSMKASSPTHPKAAAAASPAGDQTSWMSRHPSALQRFDEIANASMGKQVVMFLDYDGTLCPIVADPDRAFMSDEMRAAVKDVAKYFPTAIVSGRGRDKVRGFVKLAELYYAGSHGMDIIGPVNGHRYKKLKPKANQAVHFQAGSEFLPMIDEVYKLLVQKTKSTPGAKVENNKFCVSVHFRCVDEKRWAGLVEDVRSVLIRYPKLRQNQGRKTGFRDPSVNRMEQGKGP